MTAAWSRFQAENLCLPPHNGTRRELIKRKKYIYLCRCAPSRKGSRMACSSHRSISRSRSISMAVVTNDFAVCRDGRTTRRLSASSCPIRAWSTNTTLFEGTDPNAVREFFDTMMDVGVEGMMISPGYAYDKAPDQANFLHRRETNKLFEMILSNRKKRWRFNQSPLFLEFLMGSREYDYTPWGNPTYNIFGWQKPCYLLQEGMSIPSRSFRRKRSGRTTATVPAMRNVGTAWCTRARGNIDTPSPASRHVGHREGHALQQVRQSERDEETQEEGKHGPEAHLVQLGIDLKSGERAGAA